MTLDEHLARFVALLRQSGIPVSTAELIDALRAVAAVGLDERERFRATLAATLVKRARHMERFDRIFGLYFDGVARLLDALGASAAAAIEQAGYLDRAALERLAHDLRRLTPQLSELSRAALEADGTALLRKLRGDALLLDFSRLDGPAQQGFFARRLLDRAGLDESQQEFDALASRLAAQGYDTEGLDLVNRALKQALRRIEKAAAEWVRQEAQLRERQGEAPSAREMAFAELSPEEFELVARSVRRLADRLKTRLSYRRKSSRRGRLDVRRTLRSSAGAADSGFGRLLFRQRHTTRPELVLLCDLSDSVRPTARMTLLFALTLQSLFARTRTFAFVNELRELTEHLKGIDPRRASDLSRLGSVLDFGGNSHYGRVFGELASHQRLSLSRRTTLLVVGDGRGNYGDPGLAALEHVARQVGRLLWITPEPRQRWAEGDCELLRYEKHCTRVATVACLADLEGLADLLVPRRGD
jgi:uncharacterized protein with von Willebrand factor type A (vWA) domain